MSAVKVALIAGVDLGTSSVRCLLFDLDGQVRSSAAREYPTLSDRPGWAELAPETLLEATLEVIGRAVKAAAERWPGARVEAVGFSSHLFSVVAVDGDGRPLTRLLTWMDNRAAGEADRLSASGQAHDLYLRTGCRVHPMYPLSKLFWLKAHQPDTWQAARRFISAKEYVVERLFGERAVDYSVASSSGYFNLHRHQWDEDILGLLGLARDRFSPPVDATHQMKGLPGDLAERMGLRPETPFVLGAGDGMLAQLGCGCFRPSQVSSTIGTSGALRVLSPRPLLDERERTWCYCLDGENWVAGGAINSGGIVLRWLRDRLGAEEKAEAERRGVDPYEVLCELAAGVPPGAEGLLMLPFLAGERSPNWNARASGVLFGLQLHHTKAHLVRAALEGVIYQMLSAYEALRDLTGQDGELRATGGYVHSPLWVQIQADAFQQPVLVPRVAEASAFGAAMVAAKAVGLIDRYEALAPTIAIEQVFQPNPGNIAVYEAGYRLFRDLYDDVQAEFGRGNER
jgi:gluconokinase